MVKPKNGTKITKNVDVKLLLLQALEAGLQVVKKRLGIIPRWDADLPDDLRASCWEEFQQLAEDFPDRTPGTLEVKNHIKSMPDHWAILEAIQYVKKSLKEDVPHPDNPYL